MRASSLPAVRSPIHVGRQEVGDKAAARAVLFAADHAQRLVECVVRQRNLDERLVVEEHLGVGLDHAQGGP